jgi:hypothetical protein
MGRKVTDGQAIDVVAPGSTLVEKGEMYRIDNFTGFSADEITETEVDRAFALVVNQEIWRCKVPAGTCGTRGGYVKWSAGTGFKDAATDLADETSVLVKTAASVAKVETVRNSDGYASLKLVIT